MSNNSCFKFVSTEKFINSLLIGKSVYLGSGLYPLTETKIKDFIDNNIDEFEFHTATKTNNQILFNNGRYPTTALDDVLDNTVFYFECDNGTVWQFKTNHGNLEEFSYYFIIK